MFRWCDAFGPGSGVFTRSCASVARRSAWCIAYEASPKLGSALSDQRSTALNPGIVELFKDSDGLLPGIASAGQRRPDSFPRNGSSSQDGNRSGPRRAMAAAGIAWSRLS